jgi:DNA-binding Lrp family transcriptional regulator
LTGIGAIKTMLPHRGTQTERRLVPPAVHLDDIDRRIIGLLQVDGRMTSRAISRELGDIGDRAVRYRIDRLLRSGAISVFAVVHNEPIGFPVLGDVIVELSPTKVRDVLATLAEDDLVCYVGANLERGTISLQMAAQDEYEFNRRLNELLRTVDGSVLIKSAVVRQVAKGSDQWPPPPG